MTCHTDRPGEGREKSSDEIHFLFNNVCREGRRGDVFIQLKNHQQTHSALKTDVHSAITVLSGASEDAIQGNYTVICVRGRDKGGTVSAATSTGFGYSHALSAVAKGGRMHHSVAPSPLAAGRSERSQHNFQAGRNTLVEHA